MNRINYQKELDKIINRIEESEKTPTLLLHSCCAPCSSYCLFYLARWFSVTVFYYNPNIFPEEEYTKRAKEQKRLIERINEKVAHPVSFIEGVYEPERFFEMAKGLEEAAEGGERCFRCYEMRQKETALLAAEKKFDYFTTTLTISPLKNAQKLNEIGKKLEEETGAAYLPSDFKKRDGYKQSIALSVEYHLYRQNYCGCVFSKNS